MPLKRTPPRFRTYGRPMTPPRTRPRLESRPIAEPLPRQRRPRKLDDRPRVRRFAQRAAADRASVVLVLTDDGDPAGRPFDAGG